MYSYYYMAKPFDKNEARMPVRVEGNRISKKEIESLVPKFVSNYLNMGFDKCEVSYISRGVTNNNVRIHAGISAGMYGCGLILELFEIEEDEYVELLLD